MAHIARGRVTHRRRPGVRRTITYCRYLPARGGYRAPAVAGLFAAFLAGYAGIFLHLPF